MEKNSNLLKFWAKTSKKLNEPNAFHPLICHLIDVGVVTKKIWDNVLPTATKKRIAWQFGETDLEKVSSLVAFIAGLHDLGKCSPPFQLRGHHLRDKIGNIEKKIAQNPTNDSYYYQDLRGKLQTIKFLAIYKTTDFGIQGDLPKATDAPHGFVTSLELPQILKTFGFNEPISKQISDLIGGHHGEFINAHWRKKINKDVEANLGTKCWAEARKELATELKRILGVKDLPQNQNSKLDNGTIMILAGLVSVADWIGSDTQFFGCAVENFGKTKLKQGSLEGYFKYAEKQAEIALRSIGWLDWEINETPAEFDFLFPFQPRGSQIEAIKIAEELKTPGIVVVEEEMGKGKSETAMFLADAFNSNLKQRGIYFALPTQATSNQMFGRVVNFLEKRFETAHLATQLNHGKAYYLKNFKELKKKFREDLEKKLNYGHSATEAGLKTLKTDSKQILQDVFDESCEDCLPSVVAAEWFTHRKRGLLAPFGIGTIDQALMAVLQTKHVFVRLFGLAHKTIIIDEVHAYDAYMSALLEHLLEWLAALGSPVILLSATLPIERRNILIGAYQRGLGIKTGEIEIADYPRISYATDSTIKSRQILDSTDKPPLIIKRVTDESYIEKLKEKLNNESGCVAIICNTVERSQNLFRQLENDAWFAEKINANILNLDLFHARFPFINRQQIEERVLKQFRKPNEKGESPNRPPFSILIATQIIEQSLDIDFDLMISDLAPIDLLLQRAGRLHRHKRPERNSEFGEPVLWIIQPPTDEKGELVEDQQERNKGLPDFGKAGVIYDRHILLRTWLELRNLEQIKIPTDIQNLIEAVYEENRNCTDKKYQSFWNETKHKMKQDREKKDGKARNCLITYPADADLFLINNFSLSEDDPGKHKDFQALTRDEDIPSVSVVVLKDSEAKDKDLKTKLTDEMKEFLLEREVRISKFKLTDLILKDKDLKPLKWKNSSILRHHRLIQLDENNTKIIGDFKISLSKKLGIVIENTGGK
jgi:CRISPR-associated endonuclease/helicase Cas3